MTAAIYQDFGALVAQLRGDLFRRWMRRAQKAALLEWRDRKAPPGLDARFTKAGAEYYGFGNRKHRKPFLANVWYYSHSGDLRAMMHGRRPRSLRSDTQVVTRLKFGGGALNFLTKLTPVRSISRELHSGVAGVSAYDYTRRVKSTGVRINVTVPKHLANWKRYVRVYHRGGQSYAAEFGDFSKDREWISTRTGALFLRIFRRGVLARDGSLKSAPFAELDAEGGGA